MARPLVAPTLPGAETTSTIFHSHDRATDFEKSKLNCWTFSRSWPGRLLARAFSRAYGKCRGRFAGCPASTDVPGTVFSHSLSARRRPTQGSSTRRLNSGDDDRDRP